MDEISTCHIACHMGHSPARLPLMRGVSNMFSSHPGIGEESPHTDGLNFAVILFQGTTRFACASSGSL